MRVSCMCHACFMHFKFILKASFIMLIVTTSVALIMFAIQQMVILVNACCVKQIGNFVQNTCLDEIDSVCWCTSFGFHELNSLAWNHQVASCFDLFIWTYRSEHFSVLCCFFVVAVVHSAFWSDHLSVILHRDQFGVHVLNTCVLEFLEPPCMCHVNCITLSCMCLAC